MRTRNKGELAKLEMTPMIDVIFQFSRNISVMIKCAADSPHAYLIRTLNACAREEMPNVSVFSM